MKTQHSTSHVRRLVAAFGIAALLAIAAPARAQVNPDFDAVAWAPLGCPAADLTADASPESTNFVGNASFPAAYYAFDASYLYFRYRMDRNPASAGGFDQFAWTALMQTGTGDPFQYQYQLSLDGSTDTIEVWANTSAQDIDFSPLFHDDAEVKLFSQPFGSLARSLATGDGSNFGNDADYFLDFAFPVSDLVTHGVVANAAELADAHFFPATSTNGNNYNKGHLNCPFLPTTDVAIDKAADPTLLLANTGTPLTYTIAVSNMGAGSAKGLTITDIALPAYMTGAAVSVSSPHPLVTWEVVSSSPLEVRVPFLPSGAMVVVELAVDATPSCVDADFMNVATVAAINAMDADAVASVDVQTSDGVELCDGADNDCDGSSDEGTDALCADGDACNGSETCGGASGCQAGTPPTCDDGNACTVDGCDPSSGCTNGALPGCVPCTTPSDCTDGNACTTESCTAGVCDPSTPVPGCVPCTTAVDCGDSNPCSDDVCSPDGVCSNPARPSCIPCATDADCSDGNPCSTDQCGADGSCGFTVVPGCVPCTTASDCDDADECTTETCTGGVCGHEDVPSCPVMIEHCTDGVDNDTDASVDCADTDCQDDAACQAPAEVCGDCVDNDGDGMVDYEDSDCCAAPSTLTLRRLMVKPASGKKGNRLRLRVRDAGMPAADFSPTSGDTTLQLADANGQIFCQTIAKGNWKQRKRVFRFRDRKGAFAGGLKKGKFKVKRNGQIVFRASGKKVVLRATDGGPVRLTLRVGSHCAQSIASLRPKRKSLVFP